MRRTVLTFITKELEKFMNSRQDNSRVLLALALLVGLLASAFTAVAQTAASETALPKGIERVTSVEGITEYRLANGLRVLMFPDQSKQTITVNMTYLVGSATENYGETGMAHFLEHMVFKGTPKHTNIPQELTSHGARPTARPGRSHQLLRDLRRHRRKPQLGARSGI